MAEPLAETFGALSLAFIGASELQLAWWDKRSGGVHDGAFYNPDFARLGDDYAGYFFLGSFGVSSYAPPDGPMLLVKDVGDGSALRPADDFAPIWTDRGSGATLDGSFWRPVCRDPAYVALGAVCVRGHGKPDPARLRVALVHHSLTQPGTIGKEPVWTDRRTGARVDFSAWPVVTPDTPVAAGMLLLPPGGIAAVATHAHPRTSATGNVLLLPLTTRSNLPEAGYRPRLTAAQRPAATSSSGHHEVATVPFTAVSDRGLEPCEKIRSSPFYTIRHEEEFRLVDYRVNGSSEPLVVEVETIRGLETTRTDTVSGSVTVSYQAKIGGAFKGISAEVQTALSVTLGYTRTDSVKEIAQRRVTERYTVPPQSAFAVWTRADRITVARRNGSPAEVSVLRGTGWYQDACPLPDDRATPTVRPDGPEQQRRPRPPRRTPSKV
jgi:hypothetical protein